MTIEPYIKNKSLKIENAIIGILFLISIVYLFIINSFAGIFIFAGVCFSTWLMGSNAGLIELINRIYEKNKFYETRIMRLNLENSVLRDKIHKEKKFKNLYRRKKRKLERR